MKSMIDKPQTQSAPLTTGEAAAYCHVSQATIINWIKKGDLKAYMTPGGHYRIPVDRFISFLKAYDMPIHEELKALANPRLLIVGDPPQTTALYRQLERSGQRDIARASNVYEAGAKVVSFEPDIVIIDMGARSLDPVEMCQWLQNRSDETPITILAIRSSDQQEVAQSVDTDRCILTDVEELGNNVDALIRDN